MQLSLVNPVNYVGHSGVLQVRLLQAALSDSVDAEDWDQVRRLDQICAVLIDKIIAANDDDPRVLGLALNELKGLYASLIVRCKREVALMGR